MKAKTLILLPLKSELESVKRFVAGEQKNLGKQAVYDCPQLNAVFAGAGHGKTQFALQTQYLVDKIEGIKTLIGLGSAGALDPKLKIGDVVVGEKSIEHDYKERFEKADSPEILANTDLVKGLKKIKPESYSVFFGSIASGDEDIVTIERSRELANQTKALAVAWEGAGLARVATFNNIPFVEVRAITDNSDHNTPQNFAQNLDLAMKNASDLVTRYLNESNK